MTRIDDAAHAFGVDGRAADRDAPPRSASPGESFDDVSIGVPAARAWSLLIDLPRWPQWASAIGAVVALDGETPRIGARFSMRFASRQRAVWRIVALDERRQLALEARRPGLSARVDVELVPIGRDATRMISRVDIAGPLAEVAWRMASLRIGADLLSIATEFRLHAELQRELDALP
jgi:hypothetical protein